MTASLKGNGWHPSKWRSHQMCAALVATARAMEAGEDQAKELITQGVTTALAAAGVFGPVAGIAARAALDALMRLTPYRHWDDIHRGLQFLAVALCPAMENHPEVVGTVYGHSRQNACQMPSSRNWTCCSAIAQSQRTDLRSAGGRQNGSATIIGRTGP
jgi:hypothetical protein